MSYSIKYNISTPFFIYYTMDILKIPLIISLNFTCSIDVEQQLCGMLIWWSNQSLDDLIPQHFNWNILLLIKMQSVQSKKYDALINEINFNFLHILLHINLKFLHIYEYCPMLLQPNQKIDISL